MYTIQNGWGDPWPSFWENSIGHSLECLLEIAWNHTKFWKSQQFLTSLCLLTLVMVTLPYYSKVYKFQCLKGITQAHGPHRRNWGELEVSLRRSLVLHVLTVQEKQRDHYMKYHGLFSIYSLYKCFPKTDLQVYGPCPLAGRPWCTHLIHSVVPEWHTTKITVPQKLPKWWQAPPSFPSQGPPQ